HGSLDLREFGLDLDQISGQAKVEATANGSPVPAAITREGGEPRLAFSNPVRLEAGQSLEIRLA
ncbi:MAG: hypothetical protein GY953_22740, partial [bacterium]|nr:hypothetical protein [bacterium]